MPLTHVSAGTPAAAAVKNVLWLLLIVTALQASGQTAKVVNSREQIWFAYFNQARLTNRFGIWLDLQYRRTDNFVERPFQFLFRTALTTYITDNLRLNTGYVYALHFPAEGLETTRPEHRGWEQISYNQKYKGFALQQWVRLEQRFIHKMANDLLQEGYVYTNRIRYNASFSIPLSGKDTEPGALSAVVSDEIFINFGKNVIYNTFDQNRIFIGARYQITGGLNVQSGYMHVYQQESAGNRYIVSHVVRLTFNQSIDLRKN